MSNIPRRKIYEELLIFEEGILEIDRLIYNKENFKKYIEELPNYLEKVSNSFVTIKSLLVMFFENKIFEIEEDFEKELNYYNNNQKEINQFIKKNKNIKKEFYENNLKIDEEIKEIENNQNIEEETLREFLIDLDKFNSAIPKILEIRRDEMK